MTDINLTKEQLKEWKENKLKNPVTKRKIKEDGPIYKKIKKQYDILLKKNDNYELYRRNLIDPILLTELPISSSSNIFKFEYTWNPYNGIRSNMKDLSGPLCFDPNALIHYFYTNRLNNLWKDEEYNPEDNTFLQGYYGDAIGGFPEFNIIGRGKHPEMYLFRLPIIDCYLEDGHCRQIVTMGPILNNNEIKKINTIANKKLFKSTYKYKKPNLVNLKKLYDEAVDPLKSYDSFELSKEEIANIKYQINTSAVQRLLDFN